MIETSRRGSKPFTWLAVIAVFAFFSGCAAIEKRDTMQMERTLAAAGFHMRFSQSPEQNANTAAMTQRKLVPQIVDGRNVYVYADSEFCKCVYIGSEEAYERYQRIAIQQQLADERMQAAEMNEDAALDWGAWGPWEPWGPWR